MRDRHDSLPTSGSTTLVLATAIFAAGVTGMIAGGCGSGTGLATNSVTMCAEASCPSPRPASPSMLCPDDSVAGPACIKHADGMCGWAILTCPIRARSIRPGRRDRRQRVGSRRGPSVLRRRGGWSDRSGAAGVNASAGGSDWHRDGRYRVSDGGHDRHRQASPPGARSVAGGTLRRRRRFGAGGSPGPGNIWGTGGNGSFSWTGERRVEIDDRLL